MELVANKREITGKKVRFLRRQGITPVNLFGHHHEPMTLQCDTTQLKHVLTRTGTTGLVSLLVDKSKKSRSVMFREVQMEPVSGELLHVDLYEVDMDKRVKVEVPVITVGDAPALKMKENYLAHELNKLNIECLPGKIPNRIEVNISGLMEAGQAVHVKDLNLGEGITILNVSDQAIAKISLRFVEKVVPVAEAAVVEGEAAAEGVAVEGETKEEAKPGAARPAGAKAAA